MLDRIRRLFAPPIFEGDEEKTLTASLLNPLLISMLVVLLLAGVAVPFLFAHSTPANSSGWITNGVAALADPASRQIKMAGATHTSFGDAPLWGPGLSMYMRSGEIDGERMNQIVRAYTRAFLDEHLKGMDSDLLDGPSEDYSEVTVQLLPRPDSSVAN